MKKISYTSNQNSMKMNSVKYLMLAAFFVFGIQMIQGQEDGEMKFLLGNKSGDVHVSGFGSYILGFSSVDGEFAVYNGGGGAVLLNQTVYFGAYGMGLSSQHYYGTLTTVDYDGTENEYNNLYKKFGHGGFWIGYLHKSYKPVHFGASTKLGWGSLKLANTTYEYQFEEYNYYSVATDGVFVITPQVEVELNLLKWFKINASAGYQIVTGVDKTYTNTSGEQVKFFDASDYTKPMFNLTFAFGGFGGKR